jgi:hypothetical protein
MSDEAPTDNTKAEAKTQPLLPQPITARAGRYYRNVRYLMFLLILAMAGWFMYDGFVKYPAQAQRHAELTAEQDKLNTETPKNDERIAKVSKELKDAKARSPLDIKAQQWIGMSLVPTGIGALIFWLRRSRGAFHLNNDILEAPGHPPVPLRMITRLDSGAWDRKGIAFVMYNLGNGSEGKIVLDDFIYDRKPIDAIYEHIKQAILQKA